MSSTTKTYLNSEYLQPSSTHSYDSNQSPLALLAQTCSSIGKDCPSSPSSISTSTPPIITSLVKKSSSTNISNSDKLFFSTKNSSPLPLNNFHTHKKSTLPLKSKTISSSSSFIEPNILSNYFPPLFDPTISLTTLFLRSSLAYLSSQQHSYSTLCTIPGCLQCQTLKHFISNSINNQFYQCHWKTCNARFSSNEQLIEHIRYNHKSNSYRYHPYLKPSNLINPNDQLPYFYPHLSLSSITETTRRLNNNPDSNN